jgi:acyl carrier protein
MTHPEILDRLNGIVGDVLAIDHLSLEPTTTARDVEGWDSLTHVQIIVAVERAFNIRFRTGEMAGLANVGELVGRIAKRLPYSS